MKLLSDSNKVIGSGIIKRTKARVHNSPKIFMMLSSSLYNDKIAAPIREIGCNAIDAHIAAKNEKPFFIHRPTTSEPWFAVRDYGLGMDDQELDELYLTYGLSTKDGSDEVIGCFGLGSKSPLAYVKDNFTVTSIKDGVKYSCVVSLDENGEPELTYFPTIKTTEPSGMEVKFNVARPDIDLFTTNINNIYGMFGKYIPATNYGSIPKVQYSESHPEYSIPAVLQSQNRYSYGYSNTNQSYAIMGYIKYPIDAAQFPKYASLLNQGYHYHFSVGEIEMNISREGLQYNKKTINAINERLDKVLTKLSQNLQAELDKCESHLEVLKLLDKDVHKAKLPIIQNKLSWDKKPICLSLFYDKFEVEEIYKRGSKCRRSDMPSLSVLQHHISNCKFVYNDTGKNCTFLLNHYAETFGKVFHLIGNDKNTIDDLLKAKILTKKDIVYVSTVYDEVRELVRKKNIEVREKLGIYSKKKIFKFVPVALNHRQRAQSFWKEEEIDVDDGGVYVEINRYEPVSTIVNNNVGLNGLVFAMNNFGIKMPDIIGVKTSDVEKLSKHEEWKSLKDYCKEKIEEYIKTNKLENTLSIAIEGCQQYGSNVVANSYAHYETLIKRGNIKSGTLFDIVDNLKKADKVYQSMKKSSNIVSIIQNSMNHKIPKSTMTVKHIHDKYPLLKFADNDTLGSEAIKHFEKYVLAVDNGTF